MGRTGDAHFELGVAEAVLEMTVEGVVLEMTDEGIALEREVAIDREPVAGKVADTGNEVATETGADEEAALLEPEELVPGKVTDTGTEAVETALLGMLLEAFDVTAIEELARVVLATDEALELVAADEETGRDDVRTVVDGDDTAAEDVRTVEAGALETGEDDTADEAGTEEEETATDEADAMLLARPVLTA